ncbi:pleckstrin homology domain-containing family G member 1 [Arapaima gigas]
MPTDTFSVPLDVCRPQLETPESRRSMETLDSERPVSYSSTSSSSSSRDSHCSSLAPLCTVVPQADAQGGAIRLELVPAQQLEGADDRRKDGECGLLPAAAPAAEAVAEPGGPKPQYVDRVVQEILDTERTYVQDLRSIVQDYMGCISSQARLGLGLGPEEKGALFGNIEDIYNFNSELLRELEKCNADPVSIAECFVAKSEQFHIYTQYCTNYPRSVAVLTEFMRNKGLAKFFRERQEFLNHSLPLSSYLLKPVQRILKYHLLLHEIANHLDKQTDRYEVVLDAIDTMQRVACHINDMKRKHEHAVRLQEVQSLLMNWKGPDLISYGELVLEGTFRIQRAKNERTLFLLDRLLLITKKREESYTYKAHILCCNLMLVEIIPKEPLSFSVFHYKNPKIQHTVQAKSQQDKRMWILQLKRLILENHPAKIPAKISCTSDSAGSPGLLYSPLGDRKSQTRDGPTPRRVRRKSEPLSKLLKNSKQSGTFQTCLNLVSLGMAFLSPMGHLHPREGLLASIGRTRSLVSQSQESLDPAEPSDSEDGPHSHDTDYETEPGLAKGKKLRVQGKGTGKRLNPQVSVDSIDRWCERSVGMQDLQQAVKESLQMNPNVSHQAEGHTPTTQNPSLVAMVAGKDLVRNIWTDHQMRHAMFPTRQQAVQVDDEEDIYQMFMLSEPSDPELEASQVTEGSRVPGRPCSWHMEQTQHAKVAGSGGKVLRRASSVGEKNSCSKEPDLEDKQSSSRTSLQIDSSSSVSGSSEHLTIDDIENVYDNISYEDLKSMGLIYRGMENTQNCQETMESQPSQQSKEQISVSSRIPKSPHSLEGNPSSFRDTVPVLTCEPEAEENIYDTIGFLEQPEDPEFHCPAYISKQDSLVLQSHSMGHGGLERFISEDSLQSSDESHWVSSETESSTSSNLHSLLQKVTPVKVSEQVDEIWNDLENYIKKNEKKQERLTAAFPVNGQDSPRKSPGQDSSRRAPGQESPQKDVKHNSPQKAPKHDSPQKTAKQSSPRHTLKQESPQTAPNQDCHWNAQKLDSPQKVPGQDCSQKGLGQGSPIKAPGQDSLQKFVDHNIPLKVLGHDSFQKALEQNDQWKGAEWDTLQEVPELDSSQKVSRHDSLRKTSGKDSPQKVSRQDSLRKTSGQESPQKVSRQDSLRKTSGQKSPQKVSREDSLPKTSGQNSPQRTPMQETSRIPSEQKSPEQCASVQSGLGVFMQQPAEVKEPPLSPPVVTEKLGSTRSIKSKLARFSSGSFRVEELDTRKGVRDPQEKRALLGLSGSLFPRDFISFDNTLDSSDSIFSDTMDFPLELGDKTKNRVFLMARQYSQKIKKANQLLKSKSPEQEQNAGRVKSKQKDLADILEEKKQGGAAIGARIAEYSQLYEQVMFKEMLPSSQKNPQSSPREYSANLHSQPSPPPTPESPEKQNGPCLDEDWLNSTYSNGELINFITCLKESETKVESSTTSPHKKLTLACSSPSLMCSTIPQPATQRWSSCMAQTNKENLDQEHIFSSLGRHAPPFDQCQSSLVASSDKTADQYGKENGLVTPSRSSMIRGSAALKLGHSRRQRSLPDQFLTDHSDVTLQDSQQVLLIDRSSPLNAIIATQNYHANFKDNSDDDDDYVEIKSEDEELDSARQTVSTPRVDWFGCGDLRQSLSHPCTPIKSRPGASVSTYSEQAKLTQCLDEPQVAGQNLVQSLREKFHCLSSSSFA